jgi:chemotaxis protein CheX
MKSASEVLAANGSHENWVPLLEEAVREVFELKLNCQLTIPASTEETSRDVTAMVGLAGRLCGVLSVCCAGRAAELMTSRMLGVPLDKVAPEVADALGEICNMVAGKFKNKIAGLGDGCMLSPPIVITGSDYGLHSMADFPGLQVRMLFEGLLVVITLQIHS